MLRVYDVTQGEEPRASAPAPAQAPAVMAVLRNTTLDLHRLDGHANIVDAQRRAG
ncbi:hypothetical protein [Geodermatophilus pulveris]|uniref:hypothetical protein n=1 Tax=Geodermatophilus pulveris TaxID=1564159 RepID=UPI0015C64F8D|nr:hypothetical protein [Geodermatophilus pulveris]